MERGLADLNVTISGTIPTVFNQRQSSYLGIGLTDNAYVSQLDTRGVEEDN